MCAEQQYVFNYVFLPSVWTVQSAFTCNMHMCVEQGYVFWYVFLRCVWTTKSYFTYSICFRLKLSLCVYICVSRECLYIFHWQFSFCYHNYDAGNVRTAIDNHKLNRRVCVCWTTICVLLCVSPKCLKYTIGFYLQHAYVCWTRLCV